ncbi:family 1 glycosylhydrolase [Microbacterium esteraromaticum]|uniref:beta-glucosidase n=1 Tax=Microbacterium esteraromaticum TaxID=57043 RepID=A0A939DVE2_9MICO|nr:family 1 glycosylhydrolase [Microbacterium esteraromaticum]MBN8204992.1 family 1 glycosylhydrolase [Microbacterium esteraromaticum]MBN8415146.1 family 1 glycosylhydrolase [Microbacterium esteraromaticum]
MTRSFPDGFLFGAATAAYQIEGAAFEDGRTASIWDAFARVPGAVINAENGDVACDHYHRYADDVALMKDLGLQAYRFSTSWSRVRPDAGPVNPKGVDFYSRLVDELLAADIVPWLTLHHWDMPQALEERGGWASREVVDRFTEYALTMHDALGDRVQHWTTLNEPWCSSFLSYTAGVHAPGRTSIRDGLLASHHLLLAHGRAVQALRERDAGLDLGITLNLTVADPADPTDPRDVDAARRIDGQFNRWFLDPLFRGAYPADIVRDLREVDADAVSAWQEAVHDGDLEAISTPLDALGVNYYHGELLSGHPQPGGGDPHQTDGLDLRETASPFPADADVHWVERGLPRTAMGWEVQPEGLPRLLVRVAEEYAPGVTLYVTENGVAYDDTVDAEGQVPDVDRAEFVRAHLAAVVDAIAQGVDVRGYFYWSLMDNFEWSWGYAKRFGIVRVDYETQQRTVKQSGREYARIIAARAV